MKSNIGQQGPRTRRTGGLVQLVASVILGLGASAQALAELSISPISDLDIAAGATATASISVANSEPVENPTFVLYDKRDGGSNDPYAPTTIVPDTSYSFINNGGSSYSFSWTTGAGDGGSYLARFTVNNNGADLEATELFSVNVAQTVPGTILARTIAEPLPWYASSEPGAGFSVALETTTAQNIGYIDSGDSIEYVVDVPAAGDFNFEVDAGKGTSGTTTMTILQDDGAGVFSSVGSVGIIQSGWQTYQTYLTQITLANAGVQRLRLAFGGGANIREFRLLPPGDSVPPVITLLGDNPLYLTVGDTYVDPGVSASDDPDGDISANVMIDALGVNTAAPGAYQVTYNVSDAAMNPAVEVTRDVYVRPVEPGTPLFRVNVGGPELPAADASEPAWEQDEGNIGTADNSEFLIANSSGGSLYSGNAGSAHTGPIVIDPINHPLSASAPVPMFNTERYDVGSTPEMLWQFPVTPGNVIEVRVFFAELFNGIDVPGERVFDASVEGVVPAIFNDLDPFATAGAKGAFMRTHIYTAADNLLDLEFLHDVIENPAVKGIEIIDLSVPANNTACYPISTLDCPDVPVTLPFALDWLGGETGLEDSAAAGTGFTMVDPPSAPLTTPTDSNVPGHEPANLAVDTNAPGTLTVTSTKGIQFKQPGASSNTNSLVNGLGVGFDATVPVRIATTLQNPNFNVSAGNSSQQAGAWFWLNEDRYVKLVLVKTGTDTAKVQLAVEDLTTSSDLEEQNSGNIGTPIQDQSVTLTLELDPVAATATGFYSLNGGAETSIGSLAVPADFFTGVDHDTDGGTAPISYAGIFATHRNAAEAESIAIAFDDFSITEVLDTQAPVFTSLDNTSVAENTAGDFYTVTVDDPAASLTLSGGIDQPDLQLTDNADGTASLSFVLPPDFEAPADDDAMNDYVVEITAQDAAGNSSLQTLTVLVADADETPPVFTSPASATVEENVTLPVLTVAVDDPTASLAISGGADPLQFSLGATSNGAADLSFSAPPDFEAPADAGGDNLYNVDITAMDLAGNLSTQQIVVTVTDVTTESPPVFGPLPDTAAENGTAVGIITLDNGASTLSVTGGADQALFALVQTAPDTWELEFITAPDFEMPGDADMDNVYQVDVTATSGGGSTTQSLSITVSDISTPVETLNISTSVLGGATVVYRVNAGGPELAAIDSGPNWEADDFGPADDSPYLANEGSGDISTWPTQGLDPSVPATTPTATGGTNTGTDIYSTERYNGTPASPMLWQFPVTTGVKYEVRVYVKNGWTGSALPGQRVFNVTIDSQAFPDLTALDLSDTYGQQIGAMISHVVTGDGDGNIDIEFTHGSANNPTVNGFEIIELGTSVPEPGGDLLYTTVVNNPASNTNFISVDSLTDQLGGGAVEDIASVPGAVCVPALPLPIALLPGESFTCTYTQTVAGNFPDTIASAATVGFTDAEGNADSEFDITTASVSDSPPQPLLVTNSVGPLTIGPTVPTVLFRVNAGGPEVPAIDGGPVWTEDAPTASPYRISGGSGPSAGTPATIDDTVPATTPPAILNTQRWDNGMAGDDIADEMVWVFDTSSVPLGTDIEVRLFHADTFSGTEAVGARFFDLNIEGGPLEYDDFDHSDTATGGPGFSVGTMRSFTFPNDGEIRIEFIHQFENPSVRGIEIIAQPTVFGESGGTFTYTVNVENPGTESVTLTALDDDRVPGTLTDVLGACTPLISVLPAGGDATCTFDVLQTGADGDRFESTITATADDGEGNTTTGTSNVATVTIVELNDPPIASDDAVSATEDASQAFDVLADNGGGIDSDPNGDTLTVTEIDGGANTLGTPFSLGGALITLDAGGALTVDPNGAYESLAEGASQAIGSFTYTIDDGNGGSDTATVSVTITGVNDAPFAGPSAFTTDEDSVEPFNVLGNDGDVDGTIVVTLAGSAPADGMPVTLPSGAVITMNVGGDLLYDASASAVLNALASGETSDDNFDYVIADNNGATAMATVTVGVAGLNDAPTAQNDAVNASADAPLAGNVLSDNGSGPDSDPDNGAVLAVTEVNGNAGDVGNQIILASNALLTLNSDGTFNYDPNGAFDSLAAGQTGSDTFTYQLSDENAATSTATVTVTITGANEAPVAVDDFSLTVVDTPVDIAVLDNDTDADAGTMLVVDSFDGMSAQGGTLSENANVLTYTPPAGFIGTDTFSYTIIDGNSGSAAATVTVTVVDAIEELAKVTASDAAVGDEFGVSVSIDGDTAIIGAEKDDDGGADSGSAYVFVRSGTTWTQQARLVAADATAGDQFGHSVSIAGDTAVIGAYVAGGFSGSAYVFARSGTTWTQQAKLTADDAAGGDQFGFSVAVAGDTAVIGANTDDGVGTNSGSAYVFTRSGTAWTQQAKLTANDAAAFDFFGSSVSIAGVTAVIGAYGNDDAGSNSGSAYVFTRSGTMWTQQAKLAADDAADGDTFGLWVSVAGDTAVISAIGDDGGSGSAYVFARNGTMWTQQAKLKSNDAAGGDQFGISVSITGDTTVIGASLDDDAGNNSGSAYFFTRSGSTWTQQVKLTADDAAGSDLFGASVSISGDTAVIGAAGDSDAGQNTGSAYFFGTPVANTPPVANDDSVSTDEDTPLSGDLLAENGNGADSDLDLNPLTVSAVDGVTASVGNPVTLTSGALLTVQSTGTFDYNPNGQFETLGMGQSDTDSFTYTIEDGEGGSDTATATVTITGVNDAPVATPNGYSTNEDTALTIAAAGVLANDTDIDSPLAALEALLQSDVSSGTLALALDGGFVYTPAPNFNGQDSFTYLASDDFDANSLPVTVTLTVNPVNDVPVAVNDTLSVDEDDPLSGDVLADNGNGADFDPDLVDSLQNVLLSGAAPAGGTLVLNTDGTFLYTPDANFNGVASFDYTVSDGMLTSAPATVTITVNAVNDVPVAIDDLGNQTTVDTPLDINVVVNDTDADMGDTAALVIAGFDAMSVGGGTIAQLNDSTLTYTPPAGLEVNDSFTYTVQDPAGAISPAATVFVEVVQGNLLPEATDDTASTLGALSVNVDILDNDSLGNAPATVAITGQPAVGLAVLNPDDTITYTRPADFTGTATITYSLTDNDGDTDTGTVTITANAATVVGTVLYRVNSGGPELTPAADASLPGWGEDLKNSNSIYLSEPGSNDTFSTNAGVTLTSPTLTPASLLEALYQIERYDAPGGTEMAYSFPVTQNNVIEVRLYFSEAFSGADSDNFRIFDVAVDGNVPAVFDDLEPWDLFDGVLDGTGALNSPIMLRHFVAASSPSLVIEFLHDVMENPAIKAIEIVDLTQINVAPQAVTDNATVDEDSPAVFSYEDLTGNDVDGDVLTVTSVGIPVGGDVVLNDGGTPTDPDDDVVTYTPTAGTSGNGSFVYTVTDGNGAVASATVNVVINPVNDLPVALDDGYTTPEDTELTVPALPGVLANDTDDEGDMLTAVLDTDVSNGTLTLSADGSFTYQPDPNFAGMDSFTYFANDGIGDSVVAATVTITVSDENDVPVAVDDLDIAIEDTPLVVVAPGVLGNDTDDDGDSLTAALVSGPTQGTVTLNPDGSYEYIATVPNLAGVAVDSFTYVANDGTADSNIATVTIDITPVNDEPAPVPDDYVATEDVLLTVDALSGVLSNDIDVDSPTLTATVTTDVSNGTLVFAADGSFTYQPEVNFHGTDTFTYIVSDGVTDAPAVPVMITVTPVNDVPVGGADAFATDEDVALTVPAPGVLVNDTDVEMMALTVSLDTDVSDGTLLLAPDGGFTYTPAADYNGTDMFTYIVSDGDATSEPVPVMLTVNAVNDAPVAIDDSLSVDEDLVLSGNVLADNGLGPDSDVDSGDTLQGVLLSGATPLDGALVLNPDGSFDFTPNADFNGTVSFDYTVSDGTLASAPATVTITVIAVQDAPLAVDDGFTIDEDTLLSVPAPGILTNDTDADGETLNAVLQTGPAGTLTLNPDGSFDYTPPLDFVGLDTFTYVANDGTEDSNIATVTIDVGGVNDAPVAGDDAATTNEDNAVAIDVLANDTDSDLDPLTVSVTLPPLNGLAVVDGSQILYTPSANFFGTETFEYTADDNLGGTDVATVTVTVVSVNDVPMAIDDSETTPEETPVTVSVLANDVDVENDTLSVVDITQPLNGAAVLNGDNTVTYTPAADFNGDDTFAYSIADNGLNPTDDFQAGTTAGWSEGVTSPNPPLVIGDGGPAGAGDDYLSNASSGSVGVAGGRQVMFNRDQWAGDLSGIDAIRMDLNSADPLPVRIAIEGSDGTRYGSATAVTLAGDGQWSTATFAIDDLVLIPGANSAALSAVLADVAEVRILTAASGAAWLGDEIATTLAVDNITALSTATVTVTVTAVNDLPVAVADDVATDEDIPLLIAPLLNDTDAEGATLTLASVDSLSAQGGSVVDNMDGTVTYTPAADFNGADSFGYVVSDGTDTAAGVVNVTVAAVNDAPVALLDMATTLEEVPVNIPVLANDTDVEMDELSVSQLLVTPLNGTAVVNPDNTLTYTPFADFAGMDSFEYEITDGVALATATVEVTVGNTNDAPTVLDDVAATNEDVPVNIDVLANDTDVDGDALVIDSVAAAAGTLVVIEANNTLTFSTDANLNGTFMFSYVASDGLGGLTTGTVTVDVAAVNDAPVALDDAASISEDTPTAIDVLANDTDVDTGDTLTITLADQATNGATVSTDGSTVLFTPAADFNGPASFSYTITDGTETATATVTVTVDAVNDVPLAENDTGSTSEEAPVVIEVLSNDALGDAPSTISGFDTMSANGGGVTAAGADSFTYSPAVNFVGNDSFTYTITDGDGETSTATVTVEVSNVNDAPVAIDDVASTDEDTAVALDVRSNDTDADGDELEVTGATQGTDGQVAFTATGVTYTPAADFSGMDAFSYTVQDGNGGSATATVTVTVAPVNDAPVAVNDSATTPEDTPVDIDVLANDSDAEGDPLIVSGVTQSSKGTVSFVDAGVTYTPNLDATGTDSFSYTVSDGNGGSTTAGVTVTITPVNDAPVAVDDTATTSQDTPVTISVLLNDSDADNDPLSVTAVNTPGNGTATNLGTSVLYTPNPGFAGSDTFVYTVSDGRGGFDVATVLVTIGNVNDAPVALDDAANTDEDTAVIVDVLDNDSDTDGDTLSVLDVSTPANGAVVNLGTGISYTPDADFFGGDSFTYTVSDGNGGTDTATVSVTITGVNDAPVAGDDAVVTALDTSVDIPVLVNDTDVEGDALTIDSVTPPANGVAVLNGSSITYTPTTGFLGSDTFTYAVSDGQGGIDVGSVTVDVLELGVVSVANVSVAPTSSVSVPVSLANIPAQPLGSAQISIQFDDAVLLASSCSVDPDVTGLFTGTCVTNVDSVDIVISAPAGLNAELTLVAIDFDAIGGPGDTSPLDVVITSYDGPSGAALGVSTDDGTATLLLPGDVNCDDTRNVIDALFALQYEVGLLAGSQSCNPLPAGTLYLPACDVNGDGNCNVVDALQIQQCEVAIANPLCPDVRSQPATGYEDAPKRALPLIDEKAASSISLDTGMLVAGGSRALLPVLLEMGAKASLGAVSAVIYYDPAELEFVECLTDRTARFTLTSCNNSEPGVIRLSAAATAGVSGKAELAEVAFRRLVRSTPEVALMIEVFAAPDGSAVPVQTRSRLGDSQQSR